MAYSSYPFDGQSTTESQYRKLFKQIQQSGVITPASSLAGLKVTAAGGMNVSMAAGQAVVEGFYFDNDSATTLTVQAASSVARTDQVILRLDLDANAITPVIVRGNTSTGAATALNQSDTGTIFELLITTITVPANATSIVAANIADSRSFASNPVGVWTTDTRPSTPRVGQAGYNRTLGVIEVFLESGTWSQITQADTGWVDATYASGFTLAGAANTKLQVRVKNGIWYVRGTVKPTSGTFAANTSFTVTAALPVTRPSIVATAGGKPLSGGGGSAGSSGAVDDSNRLTLFTGGTAATYIAFDGLSAIPVD